MRAGGAGAQPDGLYRCVAGKSPFEASRPEAALATLAMLQAPPRLSHAVPATPPELDALVARMMAPQPADRLPHGMALRDALANLALSSEPDLATTTRLDTALPGGERRVVAFVLVEAPTDAQLAELHADLTPGDSHRSPDVMTTPTRTYERPPWGPDASDTEPSPRAEPRPAEKEPRAPEHVDRDTLEDGAIAAGVLAHVRRALEVYDPRVERLLDGSFVAMLAHGSTAKDLAAARRPPGSQADDRPEAPGLGRLAARRVHPHARAVDRR